VSIVIGSNDIVNPAAQDDPEFAPSPGCRFWNAGSPSRSSCRSAAQGTGYSGIENPLFFKENTRMFYGDARESLDKLLRLIK
jgi:NAD(P) transhydrogenase subunit beta